MDHIWNGPFGMVAHELFLNAEKITENLEMFHTFSPIFRIVLSMSQTIIPGMILKNSSSPEPKEKTYGPYPFFISERLGIFQ